MASAGERILVAGAGAVGSVLGTLLKRSGWDVTLLGRAEHLAAVRRDGLALAGLFGEHRVSGFTLATDVAALHGPYAAVLLTVKAYDTAAMIGAVAPHLASDGVVICLQNGLGNIEEVAKAVGPGRVIGGRVIFGAALTDPGCVRVTVYAEPVMLGSLQPGRYAGLDETATRWAAAFAAAGIPAASTSELLAYLWAKVLYNAPLNPLGAILGVTYGELAADSDLRVVMDRVIEESFVVARARGVRLRWSTAAGFCEEFYGRLVPATASHRSSMLQDLERGRPTEIDAINGRVWEYGRTVGIATPLNEAMTRLVRARVALGTGTNAGG